MGSELLFEIGTEEIPAVFLPGTLETLKKHFSEQMEKLGIPCEGVRVLGTPRRLVLWAFGLPAERPLTRRTMTGPPKNAAYDGEGNLTKAGLGFARSQKVDPSALFVEETPKGLYLALVKEEGGEPVLPLLQTVLPELFRALSFRKSMRWADRELRFARPIHWIVATFDDQVVPFEVEGIKSGAESRGMRYFGPRTFPAPNFTAYLEGCATGFIEPDPEVRRCVISRQLDAEAVRIGAVVDKDEHLLNECVYLTECPRVIIGQFDKEFLELPSEVPVTVMKHHQRYFPVYGEDGALKPYFAAVINTPVDDVRRIVHGNERVLRARLVDGQFFWKEDLETPLANRVDALKGIIFHARLGSSYDKVERFTKLACELSGRLFPGDSEILARVARACRLAKTDLVTMMVGEFPELQGVMGAIYARKNGEHEEVAQAIGEHYLPVQAGGALPQSDVGAMVSISDKLDSVVSFIAVGLPPTAGADPFALRRQTLGLLNILLERGWNVPLGELVDVALEALEALQDKRKRPAAEVRAEVLEFIKGRLRGLLVADGATPDLVEAVIAAGFENVPDVASRLNALRKLSTIGDFAPLMIAFKRAVNISRDQPDGGEEALVDLLPVEGTLYQAMLGMQALFEEDIRQGDYDQAMGRLVALKAPIDRFFDEVLVMDPDEKVRTRRLAILHRVSSLFKGVADLSLISTEL